METLTIEIIRKQMKVLSENKVPNKKLEFNCKKCHKHATYEMGQGLMIGGQLYCYNCAKEIYGIEF